MATGYMSIVAIGCSHRPIGWLMAQEVSAMKEKLQQVMSKLKERKSAQSTSRPMAPGAVTPKSAVAANNETLPDDWDMSPQDALQVGIVARYK
ncbi:MAG: hypothetical protein CL581_06520 [Alteromonadaceae bacterium]|nr:hypothetical protein [Alteromonadaceae bacterium]MBH85943.1 hypothetical protein [Alteromonadaceae bacterium]